MKISIIVPSRLAPINPANDAGPWFVERAIATARAQTVLARGHELELMVAVDPGMSARARTRISSDIRVIEAKQALQSAALNAALAEARGDAVSILEDDDHWQPMFLEQALAALGDAEFVSSTQLSTLVNGEVLRIFDFPTPSGWVMKRSTLDRVGLFNEAFRWHLDNEWLGRLATTNLPRIHLVEATAPVLPNIITQTRPVLANILRHGGAHSALLRHRLPWPMVFRTSHVNSGMSQIVADPEKSEASRNETAQLEAMYGFMPH